MLKKTFRFLIISNISNNGLKLLQAALSLRASRLRAEKVCRIWWLAAICRSSWYRLGIGKTIVCTRDFSQDKYRDKMTYFSMKIHLSTSTVMSTVTAVFFNGERTTYRGNRISKGQRISSVNAG